METPKPSAMRLSAKPRLRLNHCETRFTLPSDNDPCPKNRSNPKPTASQRKFAVAPKNKQAKPSRITFAASMRRGP